MDAVPRTLFFSGLIVSVCHVNTLVLVRTSPTVEATMGKEPLMLECAYRVTEPDIVLNINWYRKTSSEDNFSILAQIPNPTMDLPPTFNDKRLASKGTIIRQTMGIFKVIKLEIEPAECSDEGIYKCEVQVYGGRSSIKVTKVQVHLNEEPSVPYLKQHPAVLIENRPATFTCSASMGRPASTFRWLVYRNRNGSQLEEVEMSGVTSVSKMAGSCSPVGTSTLAIMIASEDQKVKCVVKQQVEDDTIQFSEERELDVKYRVTDADIYGKVGAMDLPITRQVVVHEGDDVYFVCSARGNPRPKFSWSYLPLDGGKPGSFGLVHILQHPDLTLKNMTASGSGSYVCIASNYISNMEYTDTRSVRVIVKDVVYEHEKEGLDKDISDVDRYLLIGGVVAGTILLAVFVTVLAVICLRRRSKKKHVYHAAYTGETT